MEIQAELIQGVALGIEYVDNVAIADNVIILDLFVFRILFMWGF